MEDGHELDVWKDHLFRKWKGKEGKGKGQRVTYLPLFVCLTKGNIFPFDQEMKIKLKKGTSYNVMQHLSFQSNNRSVLYKFNLIIFN